MRTSELQARYLSRFAQTLIYTVAEGPSPHIPWPETGPYNERLGYAGLSGYVTNAAKAGYAILVQARASPALEWFVRHGGFAPWHARAQAGLILKDRTGTILYNALYPERVYDTFENVPSLVTQTLLFIENRELLDTAFPRHNPAIEWDRLGAVVLALPLKLTGLGGRIPGGSTLATQIEKYRHSPNGRTDGAREKLRQMVSASVRAYMDGQNTTRHRQQIVVDYINSTPLSARGRFGEVNGIGDGLWAWFGTDFRTANRILRSQPRTELDLARQALVYRQVLSLFLAQRRPSFYLVSNRPALEKLVGSHLRLLASAGIISQPLRDAALAMPLTFAAKDPVPDPVSFVDQKAPNAIRNHLLAMLGLPGLYQLDRLDLNVDTTLDLPTQEKVVALLHKLKDPAFLEKSGLVGFRLLDNADPARVIYSFTLLERRGNANFVRVQADNWDQPLDINEKSRLDLGSTAKLRTLATYLGIVGQLHERFSSLSAEDLAAMAAEAPDPLSRWAAGYLSGTGNSDLKTMLDAAMGRQYSANPGENFFTGGGLHTFVNFDPDDNGKTVAVREAFRHSINLPFIRLMRDIVAFYRSEGTDTGEGVLADADHPARQDYLERFADREGSVYLSGFWKRYQGKSPDQALDLLVSRGRRTAERLTVIFRSVRPEGTVEELSLFLKQKIPASIPAPEMARKLYDKHAPGKYSLADRGYLARVHPLELWLVGYLRTRPGATRSQVLEASADQRQESYAWLLHSKRTAAQNIRIRTLMEEEAFSLVHAQWASLGYPFESLVPSLATAIGSSADRPDALAELVGIILNHGLKVPVIRIRQMHFAEGTPWETLMRRQVGQPERVMAPEVAETLHAALVDVATHGTAQRIHGTFSDLQGNTIPVGGKTGTGDHRFETWGPGGKLLNSRVVNRTATFVFFIGENFFGTVTAHVHGNNAANYKFTSALPAQLLKALAPALEPLVRGEDTAVAGVQNPDTSNQ